MNRRIVRLCPDDEPEDEQPEPGQPQIVPFIAEDAMGNVVTAKGSLMPKGIYERKPKGTALVDALPTPQKAGRRRAARSAATAPAKANGHGFNVALDLRARSVTINASAGSLTLAPDEVFALFAFLAGHA